MRERIEKVVDALLASIHESNYRDHVTAVADLHGEKIIVIRYDEGEDRIGLLRIDEHDNEYIAAFDTFSCHFGADDFDATNLRRRLINFLVMEMETA